MTDFALRWYRAYFEASRNSAAAAAVYSFLSVAPTVLALVGLAHLGGADTNAFAERLVDHLRLSGTTAELVRATFGTAASNVLAISVVAVGGFLLWGLGIGQIYRDVYGRAWSTHAPRLADQGRFAVWFAVLTALAAGAVLGGEQARGAGWVPFVAGWLVGSTAFWLWTPHFLLYGRVPLRALLPGALLAAVVVGGAIAASPLFLGPQLNVQGRYFGSFGVVVSLFCWAFVLITLSLVCAVFSPVWAEAHPSRTARRPAGGVARGR